MFAHRGYLSIMIFLQEIASRKIFLGAYLALKFQKKHKNEIIRRKIRAKNTRRYEKHARKKNQKKFHRSLRIRRSGVRVPSGAPRSLTKVSDLFCFVRTVRHSALRTTPPLAFHLYKEGGRGCCVRCLLFKLLCHILQQLADGQVLGADLLASAAADAV